MKTKTFIVFAVAAVALGLTTIQQNAGAFSYKNTVVVNGHKHTECDSRGCSSNLGRTVNGPDPTDPSGRNLDLNTVTSTFLQRIQNEANTIQNEANTIQKELH
jgi:hypothetical protein